MPVQAEQILEDKLVAQLAKQGCSSVCINDENGLLANLKVQLGKLNATQLSDAEFKQILNHLAKGTIFEKAKTPGTGAERSV